MKNVFPEVITNLPLADIPINGATAYLNQGETNQTLFMQFDEDVDLPEHSHAEQWGIVLEGKISLNVEGIENTYVKGDRYFIPSGMKHSGKIYAGYADITFFNQSNRYKLKDPDK